MAKQTGPKGKDTSNPRGGRRPRLLGFPTDRVGNEPQKGSVDPVSSDDSDTDS